MFLVFHVPSVLVFHVLVFQILVFQCFEANIMRRGYAKYGRVQVALFKIKFKTSF